MRGGPRAPLEKQQPGVQAEDLELGQESQKVCLHAARVQGHADH